MKDNFHGVALSVSGGSWRAWVAVVGLWVQLFARSIVLGVCSSATSYSMWVGRGASAMCSMMAVLWCLLVDCVSCVRGVLCIATM